MTKKITIIVSSLILLLSAELVQSAPIQLSLDQMDTVSAGSISASASAFAKAYGSAANTQTIIMTNTSVNRAQNKEVQSGYSLAVGSANGSNPSVTTSTSLTINGHKVVDQHSGGVNTAYAAVAYSVTYSVSLTSY